MQFSIFSVMLPEYGLPQTVEALKAHGYDAVCWRVYPKDPAKATEAPSYWGNNLSTLDLNHLERDAEEAGRLCRQAGIKISTLSSYLELDKLDFEVLERLLKAARDLDCPFVRVNAPKYDGKTPFETLMREGRERLKRVEELAAQFGRRVNIEIHMGMISCSPSLSRQLVDGRDPRHLGVIYEPANMVVEGMENHRMSLDLLGPYLANVHVKNIAWKRDGGIAWKWECVPLWEGIVDWKAVFGLLGEVGFDGLVSFEDFSPLDSTSKLRDNLAYIRNLASPKIKELA